MGAFRRQRVHAGGKASGAAATTAGRGAEKSPASAAAASAAGRGAEKSPANAAGNATGLLLGVALDALLGDPRRAHPVAAFGRVAAALERRLHADSKAAGVAYTGICVAGVTGLGLAADRLTRGRGERTSARHLSAFAPAGCPGSVPPLARTALTAAATWAVLGGTSLGREGMMMARALEAGDLEAARARLPHLCARDPQGLDAEALARATVESIAENTSDAAVAPLLWGAVGGVPGLLAYRAINTLDAMVGYRSPRHANFGWAAARLDDVANWIPARVTGLLTVACAPSAGTAPVTAVPPRAAGGALKRSAAGGAPEPGAAGGALKRSAAGGAPEPGAAGGAPKLSAPGGAPEPSAAGGASEPSDAPVDGASANGGSGEGTLRLARLRSAGDAVRRSYGTLRRDGGAHPSPNAGRCEAAFAGALGVRLGGVNAYGGRVERRPELGDGRPPEVGDIGRAVRLSTAVTVAAASLSCGVSLVRRALGQRAATQRRGAGR